MEAVNTNQTYFCINDNVRMMNGSAYQEIKICKWECIEEGNNIFSYAESDLVYITFTSEGEYSTLRRPLPIRPFAILEIPDNEIDLRVFTTYQGALKEVSNQVRRLFDVQHDDIVRLHVLLYPDEFKVEQPPQPKEQEEKHEETIQEKTEEDNRGAEVLSKS